jgi:mono/diheme cytochrome c family protein
MAGWKLTDAQIAAVASYIRSAWGNAAAPVTAGQVAPVRKDIRSSSD